MDKVEIKKEQEYLLNTKQVLSDKIILSDTLSHKLDKDFEEENANYLASMRLMNLHALGDETVNELAYQQKSLDNLIAKQQENTRVKKIYKTMLKNPYFARIDVRLTEEIENYYIGIHTLSTMDENSFMVLDWRSPLAAIFYDYDVGQAYIKTEKEDIPCQLLNKRQYKIENGELRYFFNTDVTINDEILKEKLAGLTNNKMKAIVQTLQKEQNAIIRNDMHKNLVVEGIAGSGKTAIALHRIAYILYKNRGKMHSHNIALLSPNKAFSSYISSVLPDLAEEDIKKFHLDELLKKELKKIAVVEDKLDQIERIVNDNSQLESYRFKASSECFYQIKDFANSYITKSFKPTDIVLQGATINAHQINKLFTTTYASKDILTRMLWISEYIISKHFFHITNKHKINKIKGVLLRRLYAMLEHKNPTDAYNVFLASIGKKLQLIDNKLKNEDAYLLLYLKFFIFGFTPHDEIKYLVIDEMQDYSCTQLHLINLIFDCRKIFLGDFKQNINPQNASDVMQFLQKEYDGNLQNISLKTSYRPTIEIANLFKHAGDMQDIKVISRNGTTPKLITKNGATAKTVLEQLKKLKDEFNSIAIITKTKQQAQQLYLKLKDKTNIQLIDNASQSYQKATCILSAYSSKGLEFDAVIVFDVSNKNYNTNVDNNLLYIALSRPLHHITLLSNGELNTKLKEYFALQDTD